MKGKWLITAVVASWLAASNASATIARQTVFGNQPIFSSAGTSAVNVAPVTGSLWYDDDYNVFYNPSYVMDNKNYFVVQKGMEGGFFNSAFENFAYGLYFNRGGGANAGVGDIYGGAAGVSTDGVFVAPGLNNNAAFAGGNAFDTRRPIDLFIAGDTGLKWGLRVTWAYNQNQSNATIAKPEGERTARYWNFQFGTQIMGLEPFIGATLFTKYQDDTGSQTTVQNLDEFEVGARYKYEGWTPYVVFKKYREGGNDTNVAALQGRMAQTRMNILGVGVGHDTKVADGVHVMKHLGVFYGSVEDDTGAAENVKDYKHYIIPINVALEAEATSWLTLRGGATYDFINSRKFAKLNAEPTQNTLEDKSTSQPGNTRFRIGSTFKFGKLNLDSAFGIAGNLDSTGFGFDNGTFTQMSASYRW